MRFSVIYDFDCPMSASVRAYTFRSRSLMLTERSDGEPSDWCSDIWDGKVKHRKWVGILTKAQFESFLDQTGLFGESTETMGSIGAPGFGLGIAPAISFRNDNPDAIQSAYVTPLIEVEAKRPITPERSEIAWQRAKRAVLSKYGSWSAQKWARGED